MVMSMLKKQRVTIKDVAEAARVSTQTVSRVINLRPDVSPETRERVQRVIEELGYAPNVIARSLSRGRTNTLGVVGFGLGLYGPTSFLKGIEQKSNELGFSLLLSLLDRFESTRVDEIINSLLARQVEGIIWAVPGNDHLTGQLSDRFASTSTPVVFLNRHISADHVVIAVDNCAGAQQATQHLLGQGYRQVGIITGPMDWWEAKERTAGWRDIMQTTNIDHPEDLIVHGDWTAASGDVGLHTLLAKSPDIDAVFASNDQMALGALQAARRLGLRVPEDLGIVGFDDIPEAAYFYPSLTTIRQDPQSLGEFAVDKMCTLIQARIDGQLIEPDVTWLKPRLIVRKSSIRI